MASNPISTPPLESPILSFSLLPSLSDTDINSSSKIMAINTVCPNLAPAPPVSEDRPDYIILPDLVSHCTFPLVCHQNGDKIAQETVDWMITNCVGLNETCRDALFGLRAGELSAFCYNSAPNHKLRVVSDFLAFLFHLDDISDGMMTSDNNALSDTVMNAMWFAGPDDYRPTSKQPKEEFVPGKLARDFWYRCIQDAGPGCQARFKETFELFFEAISIQAEARDTGVIPDLESYIDLRRDTSGCKPCWVLIEYGLGIDLPDFVANDSVIQALGQSTNDLVTWSNDIFSFNVEQSRGDTHNMIVILQKYHGKTIQEAVDFVGDLCKKTIDEFQMNRERVPKWGVVDGADVDEMVKIYVLGLQNWIVGALHWSFQTTRYFGTEGAKVKKSRYVKLLPVVEENK